MPFFPLSVLKFACGLTGFISMPLTSAMYSQMRACLTLSMSPRHLLILYQCLALELSGCILLLLLRSSCSCLSDSETRCHNVVHCQGKFFRCAIEFLLQRSVDLEACISEGHYVYRALCVLFDCLSWLAWDVLGPGFLQPWEFQESRAAPSAFRHLFNFMEFWFYFVPICSPSIFCAMCSVHDFPFQDRWW